MKYTLPQNVNLIIDKFAQNGFDCYIVGGSLRNMMMGIKPHDFDMTTNAKPEDILDIFSEYKTISTGIKHGTVSVVLEDEIYEITTFRIDGEYYDNRHPEEVVFTDDLQTDLSRRDFTINAMAYNHKTGVVDYFGGKEDLKNRIIRCVGNPDVRFKEDALRILRALRFSSEYGFIIENTTKNSIFENSDLLKNISAERVNQELTKLICGRFAPKVLREYREVFAVIIPELKAMFDFNQNSRHHNRDLWEHTITAFENIEWDKVLKMTMLLHDISKPETEYNDEDGVSHFDNHNEVGGVRAKEILQRLKYPNDFINKVSLLISIHDTRIKAEKPAVKKVLSKIGADNFSLLMKIQEADVSAQSDYKREQKVRNHIEVCELFKEIISNNECYSIPQLAVNGNDLISAGIREGREVGQTLSYLLDLVINGVSENSKAELLRYLQ